MNNDVYVDQCFPATQVDLCCNTLSLWPSVECYAKNVWPKEAMHGRRLARQIPQLGQNSGICMIFFSHFGEREKTISLKVVSGKWYLIPRNKTSIKRETRISPIISMFSSREIASYIFYALDVD